MTPANPAFAPNQLRIGAAPLGLAGLAKPGLALRAAGLPLAASVDEAKLAAKAGSDFEALLVTRLLKTARAAKLGDDLMGNNDQIRDMIDEARGRSLAASAPLGLAQMLAREARK
ncbi:rod-binding protein [Sandarakinorhabdus sp.]|uniref:rod-binding protein n=1 Tax=Sandarakinorhabdus sp. TaxID=1916663 RepID=UPI0033401104